MTLKRRPCTCGREEVNMKTTCRGSTQHSDKNRELHEITYKNDDLNNQWKWEFRHQKITRVGMKQRLRDTMAKSTELLGVNHLVRTRETLIEVEDLQWENRPMKIPNSDPHTGANTARSPPNFPNQQAKYGFV